MTNVFLEPNLLWIFAKKNIWKMPFKIPTNDKILPMEAGKSPSPPYSMGVEKNVGWIARYAMSIKQRTP